MREIDNYLMHYGVKGMKWKNHNYAEEPEPTGRTRGQKSSEVDSNTSGSTKTPLSPKESRQLAKEQAKWDKKRDEVYIDAWNEVSDQVNNNGYFDRLNNKWAKKFSSENWAAEPELYAQYEKEYHSDMDRMMTESIEKRIGKRPTEESFREGNSKTGGSKKGAIAVAALAGAAAVAIGAALITKKIQLNKEIARDFASADRVMKGRSTAREFIVNFK